METIFLILVFVHVFTSTLANLQLIHVKERLAVSNKKQADYIAKLIVTIESIETTK